MVEQLRARRSMVEQLPLSIKHRTLAASSTQVVWLQVWGHLELPGRGKQPGHLIRHSLQVGWGTGRKELLDWFSTSPFESDAKERRP